MSTWTKNFKIQGVPKSNILTVGIHYMNLVYKLANEQCFFVNEKGDKIYINPYLN